MTSPSQRRWPFQPMTLELARAIGRDQGNKTMRANGRKSWNHEDYNAAAEAYQAAILLIGSEPDRSQP